MMNEKKDKIDIVELGMLPPSSIDIENALLGALMIDPEQAKQVLDICKAEWFYNENNGKIYQAIYDLHEANQPIDILIVKDKLQNRNQLEKIGGPIVLSRLISKVASSSHALFHMRIIQQKYLLREVIRICAETKKICFEDEVDIDDIVHDLVESSSSLLAYTKRKEMSDMIQVIKSTVLEINDNAEKDFNFYKTNSPKFDEIVALAKKMLVLFVADKGAGKTNFIVRMMYWLCKLNSNVSVLWFCMEDPKEKMIRRFVSMITGFSERKILSKEGKLTSDEMIAIQNALSEILSNDFDINFIDTKVTYKEMKRYSRKAHELAKASGKELIIIVDNLGLVEVPHVKEDTAKENFISQELIGVREETGALIFLLHHMNKDLLNKYAIQDAFRPRENNVRGSSRLMDYANIVLLGNLPGKYDELMDVYKAKVPNLPKEQLRFNDEDFNKSFWKLNQKGDSHTSYKNIVDLRQGTMESIRTLLFNQEKFSDGTPITMNSLFERYYIYYKQKLAANDARAEGMKSTIWSVWSWINKGIYLEPVKEEKTKRDIYLFGDLDLSPTEQVEHLKQLFIIDASKVRDSGQGTKRVIYYKCDLNKNTFDEI